MNSIIDTEQKEILPIQYAQQLNLCKWTLAYFLCGYGSYVAKIVQIAKSMQAVISRDHSEGKHSILNLRN